MFEVFSKERIIVLDRYNHILSIKLGLETYFGIFCLGRVERTFLAAKLEQFIELVGNFTSCTA